VFLVLTVKNMALRAIAISLYDCGHFSSLGSGAAVRLFTFLILMPKALYRIASLLFQEYHNFLSTIYTKLDDLTLTFLP